MSSLIISVSGLRGIVGQSLHPAVAVDYVAAYASQLPEGAVVVARDGRASGRYLSDAVKAALVASGRLVLDCDVTATPTVGVAIRHWKAVGGIQISASHNPSEYNGIKLFNAEGRVIPASEGAAVKEAYQRRKTAWVPYDRLGRVEIIEDPHDAHLESLLKIVDVAAIRQRAFSVLLDSNHGAGSRLGRRLLESLGCRVTVLGDQPDGEFEHPPEPLAENLREVSADMERAAYDIGFVQDPDADRLAILDERGRYIGEEWTLSLCIARRLSQQPGTVVINGASSSVNEAIAAGYGVQCLRSSVGEAHVVDLIRRSHAVFGGEGNGGPIDPRIGWTRDSFLGIAMVLDLLAAENRQLSNLLNDFPQSQMIKSKTTMTAEELSDSIERLKERLQPDSLTETDGVRLAWKNRWILLRASNTEPIVRLIAEAPDAPSVQGLMDEALAALRR
ncbi:MAG: phosphoglucosamine mutase [Pirellulaceae bacterium]